MTLRYNNIVVERVPAFDDLRDEAVCVAWDYGMPAGTRFTLNGLLFKVTGVSQVLGPAPRNSSPLIYPWLVAGARGGVCQQVTLFHKYTEVREIACPAVDKHGSVARVSARRVYTDEHGSTGRTYTLDAFIKEYQ